MTFPFMFTETRPGPSSIGISPPSSEKMALPWRPTAEKHSSIARNRVDGAWFKFTIPECRSRQNAKVSERRTHFFFKDAPCQQRRQPTKKADCPPGMRHLILHSRAG